MNFIRSVSIQDEFFTLKVRKVPANSDLAKKLTNGITDFITQDLRPVNVVDGVGFLHLMHLAELHYTVPCRKTIMGMIDSKYTELKKVSPWGNITTRKSNN